MIAGASPRRPPARPRRAGRRPAAAYGDAVRPALLPIMPGHPAPAPGVSRLARTSSVRATRTFLTDSRRRASHSTTGTSGSMPRASRTSSRSKRRAPVECVDRDQERDVVLLEVVDRREAVLDAAGVQQHDRAERAVDQVVPEEREPVLPGRAEQVEQQRVVQGDPAEVQGHGRGGLRRTPPEVSSIPIDRSVISASVTSGSISEIAPMKVVLPTPKPPLMTIFTATGGSGGRS